MSNVQIRRVLKVVTSLFHSKDVPKIVVLVTDGYSDNNGKTLKQAKLLLQTGVKVFSVGVGSSIKVSELKAIASDPDCLHLFVLKNFTEFEAFVTHIEQKFCECA